MYVCQNLCTRCSFQCIIKLIPVPKNLHATEGTGIPASLRIPAEEGLMHFKYIA